MWLSGLCLAWSSKTLGSFPSTEKNKTNHNLKKKKSAMAAGLGRATGILGLPALPAVPRAYRGKGSPHVSCPLHLSHLDPKAPAWT